jgi:hypothetical protein
MVGLALWQALTLPLRVPVALTLGLLLPEAQGLAERVACWVLGAGLTVPLAEAQALTLPVLQVLPLALTVREGVLQGVGDRERLTVTVTERVAR